ncbi:MAG: NAD-dependent epimerase/dehydratase family protein [Sphingobacteriales bacterium]|nr:MAG: NAD-dependent epimerase/dehydratase family protein [Sphingobacteriales bacterium]
MVIGTGMVAQRFKKMEHQDHLLIFASGVSNSKCEDDLAYKREYDLLLNAITQNPGKHMVYFSTTSIFDPFETESKYVRHKLALEQLIKERASSFNIFRISNLVGHSDNKNTVINFYVGQILHGAAFQLWQNATRNLIDIDDAFLVMQHILVNALFKNGIVNIANTESYTTGRIINEIETFFGRKAIYEEVNRGTAFSIDISAIEPIINQLGINFDKAYLTNLLNKYYAVKP